MMAGEKGTNMNKIRRKALQDIIDRMEALMDDLETIRDEEQEAFDNLPEGIQTSERGEAMENAIYNMDATLDEIMTCKDYIEEAME